MQMHPILQRMNMCLNATVVSDINSQCGMALYIVSSTTFGIEIPVGRSGIQPLNPTVFISDEEEKLVVLLMTDTQLY